MPFIQLLLGDLSCLPGIGKDIAIEVLAKPGMTDRTLRLFIEVDDIDSKTQIVSDSLVATHKRDRYVFSLSASKHKLRDGRRISYELWADNEQFCDTCSNLTTANEGRALLNRAVADSIAGLRAATALVVTRRGRLRQDSSLLRSIMNGVEVSPSGDVLREIVALMDSLSGMGGQIAVLQDSLSNLNGRSVALATRLYSRQFLSRAQFFIDRNRKILAHGDDGKVLAALPWIDDSDVIYRLVAARFTTQPNDTTADRTSEVPAAEPAFAYVLEPLQRYPSGDFSYTVGSSQQRERGIGGTFQVRVDETRAFGVRVGLVKSFIDRNEFTIESDTIRSESAGDPQIVINLLFYAPLRNVKRQPTIGEILAPNLFVGVDPTEPTKNLFLGGSIELSQWSDFIAGVHLGKVDVLRGGFVVGGPAMGAEAAGTVVHEDWKAGLFLGGSVDIGIVATVLGGIIKIAGV